MAVHFLLIVSTVQLQAGADSHLERSAAQRFDGTHVSVDDVEPLVLLPQLEAEDIDTPGRLIQPKLALGSHFLRAAPNDSLRPRALSNSSDATVTPLPRLLRRVKSPRAQLALAASNVDAVVQSGSDGDDDYVVAVDMPNTGHTSVDSQARKATSSADNEIQAIAVAPSATLQPPPRILRSVISFLQLLSLVPASIGVLYCLWCAAFPSPGTLSYFRRTEWLLSALWAALSGRYCYAMARGLTRRWVIYYPLAAALVRLASLQVICWPLTNYTVNHFFGREHCSLSAWIVCALTASISNTVQIWVTSNLRFLDISGAGPQEADWALALQQSFVTTSDAVQQLRRRRLHPRGLRSEQVIRQTVLPIAACCFVTMVWALCEIYATRESRA